MGFPNAKGCMWYNISRRSVGRIPRGCISQISGDQLARSKINMNLQPNRVTEFFLLDNRARSACVFL